jgi:hypothetical protein
LLREEFLVDAHDQELFLVRAIEDADAPALGQGFTSRPASLTYVEEPIAGRDADASALPVSPSFSQVCAISTLDERIGLVGHRYF